MPAWWGRKSTKHKDETQNQPTQHSPQGTNHFGFLKSPVRNDAKRTKDKPKSFDEVLTRVSPRLSREFPAAATPVSPPPPPCGPSSGFSGFDSDGSRCHPLPRPSISSMPSLGNDQGNGLGFGSGSVSSVSSNGSSEDHPIGLENGQLGFYRGHPDAKQNVRPRSPGPGSRGPTSPTSPLHPMLSAMSLESPTGKPEDGKTQCHPLPLPPGSPTSPSALPTTRSCGVTDVTTCTLSKWKKGKLLGRGSFGHVYIGFNSEGGQMCAIKEVRLVSDDHTSKESLKQLHQEINLLSQLSHQNIVRYYGSELVDDALSVYLEYVSGGSIHKLLQDYGAFKEPVIQNYTRQILSGLAYLHGRNTVHRDIKGANILVDPNGEIKLADFGMAKHIANCSSMLSFKGSPYWMAPEVVMNTNGYSLAVDIWSLGCTVLEMATSKPPWSQYEGVAAIFKIGNSKDMPEIPDYLSQDAKSFVKLCLQRDPLSRPTAARLLEHPFIREQTTSRAANTTITQDAFPFAFDGSRTPPILEPVVTPPRGARSPRDNARMITSLPVSPCSSPLRQYGGGAQRSYFLSPPHPTFAMMGQSAYNMTEYSSYNVSEYSSYPTRSSTASYTRDPFREVLSEHKARTPPGGSPRTRFL
ncbi:mitogen-activated protein kinase kinase kinase 3 [Humulus lupulus]|uniref:mitogen-activated protein kinase kinase kinase 3 n=1 Tax=Humulus lupulus TaxID=3486 RepID=UPI002B4069A2|nr:mitogen-activated protein kinase kinase kinase 3 [Humulus lupulus]